MTTNQGIQPWNDRKLTRDLLASVRSLRRRPYESVRVPPTPGVYVMFMASERPAMVELLTETVAHGSVPCYVGSSSGAGTGTNLRTRLQRYRQILRDLPGFDLSEIWISALPCDSRAAALYAEAALLDTITPILNRVGGFGSMTPGARRRTQRSSPIDALFAPGRQWAQPPTVADQVRARCTLLAALADLDPGGPRWPPLIGTGKTTVTRDTARVSRAPIGRPGGGRDA